MELLWYLDRGTALVAWTALYLAVVTGVLANSRAFGVLHEAAAAVHVPVSVLATLVTLVHGVIGAADTWLVSIGAVPAPPIPRWYFLAGVGIGGGGLLLVVVAVLAFLDPRRFERPWSPRVVHAFAYGGFGFATLHATAVGTDIDAVVHAGVTGAMVALIYLLALRFAVEAGMIRPTTGGVAES